MRRFTSTYERDSDEQALPRLLEVLAEAGEGISEDPETYKDELCRVVAALRDLFGLAAVELRVTVGESQPLLATDGPAPEESPDVEVRILRGKMKVGSLSAYLPDPDFRSADRVPPGISAALRAAAAFCALAVGGAHAREVASVRAAQGSMVQVASEALGSIQDEAQLYKTVLALSLELLDATEAAVVTENEAAICTTGGCNDVLEALRAVSFQGRRPHFGRAGGYHALGVPIGRSGGALFLLRESRAYADADATALKLVARQLARARERSRLYASLEEATLDVISALAAALESRDGTTGEHIHRTQDLVEKVATEMGLGGEETRTAQYAAALHDIGKIGIPDAILNKPGKLTDKEWEVMRTHARIGADILFRISGFEDVAEAVLAHHERHDGQGYPRRLPGPDIPFGSRLISVIDAFDAMTNDRPYRKGMSLEKAIAELDKNSGSQFDPGVVEAFEKVLLESTEEERDE